MGIGNLLPLGKEVSLCILLSYPLKSLSLDHANNALHPGGGVQSDI